MTSVNVERGLVLGGAITQEGLRGLMKYLGVALQLGLLLLVVREFQLENTAFIQLVALTLVGFLINAILPLRLRLPFFVLVSLTGIWLVLGPTAAAWLIGVSLFLIGLAHLPIGFWWRVGILAVVGAVTAAARVDLLPVPWSRAIWPILGSMFMFRMIIYLYDLKHDKTPPTVGQTLAYFFLLPNVAFPLFPVVDFRTFRRTYYDAEQYGIYQRGVEWIFRGIIHLILYRVVYYYLAISPEQVQNTGDLVRFLVTNYLLYLRISGHFHIIVGMLHVFGFNLPETHHLYYLASSFTDYWRRINIYWKDFMMKIFYYPAFFKLRKLGPTTALVLATFVVFFATMMLHSYQWFWIRGTFPLQTQDTVFWTILALLVVVNAVLEAKRGRKRSLKGGRKWSWLVAVKTLATFAVICSLWSLWTSTSVSDWLVMWSVLGDGIAFDWREVTPALGMVALSFAVTMAPGPLAREAMRNEKRAKAAARSRSPSRRATLFALFGGARPGLLTGVAIFALWALTHPAVLDRMGSTPAAVISSLKSQRLSDEDRSLLERGYYENLLGVDQFNAELARLYERRPDAWVNLWETPANIDTDDMLRRVLAPSVSIQYKGKPLTTNQWGMRDREYTLAKAPGAYRIALLGSSPIMGTGVGDDETFDHYLETRLGGGERAYEVLNFGVESYTILQQVRLAETIVPRFAPDAVLYFAHETEAEKTVGQLATLLQNRIPIPYPELLAIAEQAGVEPGTRRLVGVRRLQAYDDQVLRWGYRRFGELVRAAGAVPVLVFMPMPAEGGRECERASTCFGSTTGDGGTADRSDPRVDRVLDLAEEAGLSVANLSGAYAGHDLPSLWLAEWDTHPNAKGQELAAERLYQILSADDTPLPQGRFTRRHAGANPSEEG